MAAPIVYEGVNGKYEGSLFNGMRFWVAQRVPDRSHFVSKIQDNGGKIVLLEKLADVLIDDHARKQGCAPGSVSWKYIDQCVASGELANIEDYRIHHANGPRPVGSSKPVRGIRVPFTKEDEQILVTWVRRAGKDTSGNAIYIDLAEKYPQHTWQSWRQKWVKHLSLLPENQLPPVLAELPPPRARPGGVPEAMPATAIPQPKPAPSRLRGETAAGSARAQKIRNFFTEEDDKLLTEYVKQRCGASRKWSGNEMYKDFEEHHPQHTWHSWRDRWLKVLSRRENQDVTASESKAEPARPRPEPTPASAPAPQPSRPEAPQPRSATPAISLAVDPPPPQAPPTRPPPTAPPARTVSPGVTGQGMTRLQELAEKRKRVTAARTIQPVVKGFLLRRRLQRAEMHIAAFQARAQGFLTRKTLGFPKMITEPENTTLLSTAMQAPVDDELPVLGDEEDEEEEEETGEEEEPVQEEPEPIVDAGDEDEEPIPEKLACAIDRREEEEGSAAPQDDDVGRTQYYTAPTSQQNSPLLSKEEFWPVINHYNDSEGKNVMPVPWVQIGHHVVDLWDLWRCATAEPQFSRDWAVVAEALGFDWISEPHMPGELKAAFEKHLLDLENRVRAFLRDDEEQGEETQKGEEEEEGSGVEEREEVIAEEVEEEFEAVEDEEMREQTASQAPSLNFKSSPPVIGAKRTRRLSATLHFGSVRKRPRYDVSSEIPETPETRTERAGQGTAAARAAAAGQETPSRRPRVVPQTEQQLKSAAPAQFDGSDGDDGDNNRLSPSQQLLSEIEAVSSAQGPSQGPSQDLPRIPSSPNRPLPSVERDDDETSESSDAFESPSKLPVRSHPNPTVHEPDGIPRRRTLPWAKDGSNHGILPNLSEAPRRRTLPWAEAEKKGRQQASNTPRPPPRTFMTATTTLAQPASTPHIHIPATRTTQAPPPASLSSKPPASTPKNQPLDPAPLVHHFISQGYAPHLVVCAVKASTCREPKAQIILNSLSQGKGIPADVRGVWTEEDDRLLKEIGPSIDRLRGVVPHRGDREAFGEGDGRRVFWRLVAKHGGEGVFERREFLRNWDQA